MQHQLYHIEHSCIIYQDAYRQGLKEKKRPQRYKRSEFKVLWKLQGRVSFGRSSARLILRRSYLDRALKGK